MTTPRVPPAPLPPVSGQIRAIQRPDGTPGLVLLYRVPTTAAPPATVGACPLRDRVPLDAAWELGLAGGGGPLGTPYLIDVQYPVPVAVADLGAYRGTVGTFPLEYLRARIGAQRPPTPGVPIALQLAAADGTATWQLILHNDNSTDGLDRPAARRRRRPTRRAAAPHHQEE